MCACCVRVSPLGAQNQTPTASPDSNLPHSAPQVAPGQDQPAIGQLPPSPVDQQEQLIRQVDPLDREGEKTAREKADRDGNKAQDNIPIPGSIAESEQSAARRSGPKVEDDENGAPVQEYTGPAVLSRSYSISQSLVPEQIKWNESVGLSTVYDTGVTRSVNADGTPGPLTALTGAMATWSFSGRHYFHRDVVTFSYSGNYSRYSGNGNKWRLQRR